MSIQLRKCEPDHGYSRTGVIGGPDDARLNRAMQRSQNRDGCPPLSKSRCSVRGLDGSKPDGVAECVRLVASALPAGFDAPPCALRRGFRALASARRWRSTGQDPAGQPQQAEQEPQPVGCV